RIRDLPACEEFPDDAVLELFAGEVEPPDTRIAEGENVGVDRDELLEVDGGVSVEGAGAEALRDVLAAGRGQDRVEQRALGRHVADAIPARNGDASRRCRACKLGK